MSTHLKDTIIKFQDRIHAEERQRARDHAKNVFGKVRKTPDEMSSNYLKRFVKFQNNCLGIMLTYLTQEGYEVERKQRQIAVDHFKELLQPYEVELASRVMLGHVK